MVVSVHDGLPYQVITALHSKPSRRRQEAASAAPRADTSVTGAEQTNPRHTYAAGRPATGGRPASRGTPGASGSPTTTTAPGLVEARAAAARASRSGPAGPLTATSSGPASSASPTASAQPTARGARSASFASCPTAASPSSRCRGAPASAAYDTAAPATAAMPDDVQQVPAQLQPAPLAGGLVQREQSLGRVAVVLEHPGRGAGDAVPRGSAQPPADPV